MAYMAIVKGIHLPSPHTTSFQALSVNAFRWRIRDERPGDGLDNLGARKREYFCFFEKF